MTSMFHALKSAATALMLIGSITLTGCHALIAQPLRTAMHGESHSDLESKRIRGLSCDHLAGEIGSLQKAIDGGAAPVVLDAWRDGMNERKQASAAKGCASSQGMAATQRPAKVEPVSGAAGMTDSMGYLGVRIGNVDATMAKALGLKTPRGAMVVELDPKAPSGGNGLKPLDVVLEIAGQEVMNFTDLPPIVQRMRPGYKAPLRIWRDRAEKELLVVIGAAPQVQQAATPAAAVPDRALPASAPPAGPPRFCYAFLYLVQIGKPVGVQSSIWEERGPDFSHAAQLRSMSSFVAHMRQMQPGIWHDDFPDGKCHPGLNQCDASSTRIFGATQQVNQFCHETREQAEGARKRQGIGLPVIEWTPPVAP